jgi:hypothetical protein
MLQPTRHGRSFQRGAFGYAATLGAGVDEVIVERLEAGAGESPCDLCRHPPDLHTEVKSPFFPGVLRISKRVCHFFSTFLRNRVEDAIHSTSTRKKWEVIVRQVRLPYAPPLITKDLRRSASKNGKTAPLNYSGLDLLFLKIRVLDFKLCLLHSRLSQCKDGVGEVAQRPCAYGRIEQAVPEWERLDLGPGKVNYSR